MMSCIADWILGFDRACRISGSWRISCGISPRPPSPGPPPKPPMLNWRSGGDRFSKILHLKGFNERGHFNDMSIAQGTFFFLLLTDLSTTTGTQGSLLGTL